MDRITFNQGKVSGVLYGLRANSLVGNRREIKSNE